MSDTPETGEVFLIEGNWNTFAKQLKRERDKWEETARIYCQNSDYHREMREKAERERDEARAKLEDWEDSAKHVRSEWPDEQHCSCVPILRKLLKDAERERDDYMERCRTALSERDSWRMRAEQKYAMRRELEELLGVDQKDASDEQFQKGLDAIKNMIRERDEAREVARLLKSTLDLIKNDQLKS